MRRTKRTTKPDRQRSDAGFITHYPIRMAAILAFTCLLAFEFGAPIATWYGLESEAQRALPDALDALRRNENISDAREEFEGTLPDGIELVEWTVFPTEGSRNDTVIFSIEKRSPSLLFGKIDAFSDRYDIRASIEGSRT